MLAPAKWFRLALKFEEILKIGSSFALPLTLYQVHINAKDYSLENPYPTQAESPHSINVVITSANATRSTSPKATIPRGATFLGFGKSFDGVCISNSIATAKMEEANTINAHVYRLRPSTGSPNVGNPGQMCRQICLRDIEPPNIAAKRDIA